MIETTTAIQVFIALVIIIGTALVIDYISKKTGKDPRVAINKATKLVEEVEKAIEDGKISEEEAEKISEAALLLKDEVEPYIDYIADSGIIAAIYQKIKEIWH